MYVYIYIYTHISLNIYTNIYWLVDVRNSKNKVCPLSISPQKRAIFHLWKPFLLIFVELFLICRELAARGRAQWQEPSTFFLNLNSPSLFFSTLTLPSPSFISNSLSPLSPLLLLSRGLSFSLSRAPSLARAHALFTVVCTHTHTSWVGIVWIPGDLFSMAHSHTLTHTYIYIHTHTHTHTHNGWVWYHMISSTE